MEGHLNENKEHVNECAEGSSKGIMSDERVERIENDTKMTYYIASMNGGKGDQ